MSHPADPHVGDRPAADPSCPNGVCSASAPPLIGSTLTGTGLTLDRAAQLLAEGRELPLTDLQRRIVEQRVIDAGLAL
ncbi:hypothetical protein [Patulibacter sp. SYSU D01012]|uniref:hypothetical protein n=1 Tax=Patulibacter sp. SYSU D01012 TaxID=2817381 RepID=UPI001B3042A4|nr:hypothetical protein [Patulibacter sp. SYSU D01012]